jgi:hypothetical protein
VNLSLDPEEPLAHWGLLRSGKMTATVIPLENLMSSQPGQQHRYFLQATRIFITVPRVAIHYDKS